MLESPPGGLIGGLLVVICGTVVVQSSLLPRCPSFALAAGRLNRRKARVCLRFLFASCSLKRLAKVISPVPRVVHALAFFLLPFPAPVLSARNLRRFENGSNGVEVGLVRKQ